MGCSGGAQHIYVRVKMSVVTEGGLQHRVKPTQDRMTSLSTFTKLLQCNHMKAVMNLSSKCRFLKSIYRHTRVSAVLPRPRDGQHLFKAFSQHAAAETTNCLTIISFVHKCYIFCICKLGLNIKY